MNQLARKMDWTSIRERADFGSNKLQNDLESESDLAAALAEAWSIQMAREKQQILFSVSEVQNPPTAAYFVGKATLNLFKTPAIHIDAIRRPRSTFAALQEWEGYVVDVTDSKVIANLVDLTAGSMRPNEQAEIPLEEFSEDDIPKLLPGRVFRWAIGYQRQPSGTKMRISNIVVRDLPQWSQRELEEAEEEAQELYEFLNRG
jgi:hypothetical protein